MCDFSNKTEFRLDYAPHAILYTHVTVQYYITCLKLTFANIMAIESNLLLNYKHFHNQAASL